MDVTHFDTISKALTARRLTRRSALVGGTAALAAGVLGAPRSGRAAQGTATPQASDASDPAAAIGAIAREAMSTYDLKALILRVTIDGEEVVTTALGESMSGVPATTDMHFRSPRRSGRSAQIVSSPARQDQRAGAGNGWSWGWVGDSDTRAGGNTIGNAHCQRAGRSGRTGV